MLEHFPASAEARSLHCAAGRRAQSLEAAAANDFIIVEDDYAFAMSFLAPRSPALRAFDRGGRALCIGGFSEALFPGLGLGYLVALVIREARALRTLMPRRPYRLFRMGLFVDRGRQHRRRPGITRKGPHS